MSNEESNFKPSYSLTIKDDVINASDVLHFDTNYEKDSD